MPDYSKGQIYIIRNHVDDRVYIGSTTQTLAQRMSVHRADARRDAKRNLKLYKAFGEIGFDSFYIERLEEFPCNDVQALVSREGFYIRLFNSVNEGFNGKVSGRTGTEAKAYYSEKHRDYNRNYKANKRATDIEYLQKSREYAKKYMADKRANDPEYRERKAKINKEYYEKKIANDPEYREREKIRKREYMAHKRANDAEYRENHRNYNINYLADKRANDAEYRERNKKYCKEHYEKKMANDPEYRDREKIRKREYMAHKRAKKGTSPKQSRPINQPGQ